MSAVRQQVCGVWQAAQQPPRPGVVRQLSGGQNHPDGAAQRVCHGVQLGVSSTPGEPGQAVRAPFFEPQARCGPVRLQVRSIDRKRVCLFARPGRFFRHPGEDLFVRATLPEFQREVQRFKRNAI